MKYATLDNYSEKLHEKVKIFDPMREFQRTHWVENIIKTPRFKVDGEYKDLKWGCAMIIKNEKGEILLGKRSDFCNEAGKWGFPGGSIENEQEADDAVIRECYEETNLIPWEMELVNLEGNRLDKMNFIYETTIDKCSGYLKRQASEVSKLEWFAPDKIDSIMYKNDMLFKASKKTWEIYRGKPTTKKIFCSGHRDLTKEEFNINYKYDLDIVVDINDSVEFYVGNWEGADKMIQKYLLKYVKNDMNVKVNVCVNYDMSEEDIPKEYNILRGFYDWADADGFMTRNTDEDITWIREGKEDSGSAQNIQRRIDYNNSLKANPNFKR